MICGMAITLGFLMSITFWQKRKPCLEVKPKRIMCLDKPTLYVLTVILCWHKCFLALIKDMKANLVYHSIQNRLILQQKVKGAQRLKKYINKSLRILTKQLPCWATQVKENISAISMRLLPQV